MYPATFELSELPGILDKQRRLFFRNLATDELTHFYPDGIGYRGSDTAGRLDNEVPPVVEQQDRAAYGI